MHSATVSILETKIISQEEIIPGYFQLSFSAPEISRFAQAGQFVHIYCGGKTFLRRPFSIAGVKDKEIKIIYQVVGEGTKLLSEKKKGETLDVLGPLGTGFSLSTINYQRSTMLIAGGTGIASLLFLAQELKKLYTLHLPRFIVFVGAKTKNDLLGISEFKKFGCKVKLATEDGSLGFKGLVTDLFRDSLITHHSSLITAVFACGPYPMLKKIAQITHHYKIPCQVSLEATMACGLGACRGCVVKVRSEAQGTRHEFIYKTVCKDGPVFDAKAIIWE